MITPAVIAHADWGTAPLKRQLAAARLLPGGVGYEVVSVAPAPTGQPPQGDLFQYLSAEAEPGQAMIGFDFPVGLPVAYAKAAGISSFPEFLDAFGSPPPPWQEFATVARHRDEITLHRPFYPDRPGGTKREHLYLALGLTAAELRRRSEGTDAEALFWTLGGKQVGKGALAGWRLLAVARHREPGIAPGEPPDPEITTTEGWILGRSSCDPIGSPRRPSRDSHHTPRRPSQDSYHTPPPSQLRLASHVVVEPCRARLWQDLLLISSPGYRRLVAVRIQIGRVAALAQRGSLSARERHPAVQRERHLAAPNRDEAAKEPEQDQQPDSGLKIAADKTAAVERQIKSLDEMLTSALPIAPLTFEALVISPSPPRFDPAHSSPGHEPAWGNYAPVRPGVLRLLLGAATRYRRELAAARTRFEAAQTEHRNQESQRRQALAAAKARHDRRVTEERAKAAKHNADLAARQRAFAAGQPEAVEWFVARVLDASRYPGIFPRERRVTYRPERREVEVEFEFPPPRIVPPVRSFRYLKTRDAVEPLARPQSEIRDRYQRLVSCITLRTLHEVFTATPAGIVERVVFHGRVGTVDPATGQPARPHLLSVSVDRSTFDTLVLASVDPTACLTHLGARMSASPFDLEPVDPEVRS